MKPKHFAADTSGIAFPEPVSDCSCSLGQFSSLGCNTDLMSTILSSPAATSLVSDYDMDLQAKPSGLGASTAWGRPSGGENFPPLRRFQLFHVA